MPRPIIGATGKTSDYWQSDENWWQRAITLGADQAHLEGVHFDEKRPCPLDRHRDSNL